MNCWTGFEAIVNKLPGVNEVLALVDQLKALIQDFSARDEKLESELRARAAENRAYQRVVEEETLAQAQRVDKFEAEFEERLQRCHAGYERRKVRINQA